MKKRQVRVIASNNYQAFFLLAISFLFIWGSCHDASREKFEVLDYYDNGKPRISVKVVDVENGKLLHKVFYENGELKSQFFTKNEKLYGKALQYYPSGQLKKQQYYKEGRRHGEGYDYKLSSEVITKHYYFHDSLIYYKEMLTPYPEDIRRHHYLAFWTLDKNTIEREDELLLSVSLPIPDSLYPEIGALEFCYEVFPGTFSGELSAPLSNCLPLTNSSTKYSIPIPISTPVDSIVSFVGQTVFTVEDGGRTMAFKKELKVVD
jgi:hypothetical protein